MTKNANNMAENITAAGVNYAEEVRKTLDLLQVKYSESIKNNGMFFIVPVPALSIPSFNINMNISFDGSSKIVSYIANAISKTKVSAMLRTINNLANRYRFVSLTVDNDNDVCVSYDFQLFGTADDVSVQVMYYFVMMRKIIDNCIPEIMKTIWQEEDTSDLLLELFDDSESEV